MNNAVQYIPLYLGLPEVRTPLGNVDVTIAIYMYCAIQPLKLGHLSNRDTSLIRTPH